MPTKKAAPKKSVKKASPKKTTTKKASTRKPATTTSKKATPAKEPTRGLGRPKGHGNYVPEKALEVRDTGNFKQVFDGDHGPRWIRVYAGTQEASIQLQNLAALIEAEDKKLLSMISPPKAPRTKK